MKKNFLVSLSVITMLVLFTISCGKKTSNEKIQWKLGHIADSANIWHRTAEVFANSVSNKTGGNMTVALFPDSQLGSEIDNINSIQLGTCDLAISGESMANWAPKAAFAAVPYVFRDTAHLDKVINGPIGKEITDEIAEKVGLKALYYHKRSPRNLTSNKVIKSVDDIKGLIIRVPTVPLFVKAWEALGAKPTPMALNEVFTALQNNTIQAQENPFDMTYSRKFYEVQKYAYETEHVVGLVWVLVGVKQFEALPDDYKKAVLEAAKEAQVFADTEFTVDAERARKGLLDAGMQIMPVNKEEYIAKVKPAMEANLTPEQLPVYKAILETK